MEPVRPFLSLYNPINLAYRDKMLEQDYISYHQQNSIKHIRIAMPIAIILYTAFAWLDYILFPEIAVSFIKIRLFIVAPFLILVIINTFIDTKGKYLQLLTSLSVLVGGFGVLGMLYIGGEKIFGLYYVGIALIFFFNYDFLKLRFLPATIVGFILLLSYLLLALVYDVSNEVLVSSLFFLVSTNIMGSISCYLFDYASRKYFYSNHLLIMESRKTEDLNLHLEAQVQQRTASLEEANRELVAANEIAEESGKMKSVFLATMSHELRTPLTAIIGFSEIVLSGENDKEEIQSISKIINNSGHHLLSLVESLLDITLIEAGQVHLRKGEVRLVELLADVNSIIRQEQTKLEKQDIKISIDTKTFKSDYLVITDGFKVKQILINLLKNSLKFTENGEIVFGCEEIIQRGDKYLKFHVIDTGIGIADDKKEFIFDVFRQIDDTHSRKYGGVGIGLTVVHKLTHLLGGKVWVDSVVGKGSSFYFTIRNYENLESEIFDVEDYV